MTDTLEPPIQQETVQADPNKVAAPSQPSSFQQRMAETRAKAALEVAGGDGASPSEKAVVEARQERRRQSEAPDKAKDAKASQSAPESKETATSKSPFDILNDLQVKGLDENTESKVDEKTPPAPAGSSDKAISTWKEMNAALDQAKKDLAEARAVGSADDIKTAKAELEATKKEIETIKKDSEEVRNKLAAKDVKESREYKEQVQVPLDRILTELQETTKEFNIPWRSMVDVIESTSKSERNAALSKLLTEAHKAPANPDDEPTPMDEISRLEMVSSLNEFLQRDAYGKKLEAEAGAVQEALKQKEAKESSERKTQTETQFKKTADMVFEKMKDAIPQLKDDPEFAKLVRGAAQMKDDPPHIRAMKDIWMASAERVLKDHQAKHEADSTKIRELEERIGKLTNAGPTVEQTDGDGGGASLEDKRPLSVRLAETRRANGQ